MAEQNACAEDIVRSLAVTASISLSETEITDPARDLEILIGQADALPPLEKDGSDEPSVPVLHDREDIAHDPLPYSALERNAPEMQDGCFALPRVIGGEA